ncbi:Beta-catenin-like protein 1 [Polyplax serrata]|uniref:Beta-catenin-like protein 1 n=1 Tax=Polyplax serrata TaxID=468196 RepID=A0AAN8PJ16_POLSC
MDIGDILSFKPINTPKRPHDGDSDDEDDDYNKQRKMRKMAKARVVEIERAEKVRRMKEELERKLLEEANESSSGTGVTNEERERIQQMLEEAAANEEDVMDEAALKKLTLLFEKRTLKNQEMRIKFPENPEKFMESEVELHEAIQELHVVATVPDLYPILVQLNAINSLLELLSHENTDIAVAVVDLLQEITDVDILHESQEGADALIDALLDLQICALLVQNLERLDETVKEEAEGVHNTLAIFENLTEFRPQICSHAAKQGLFTWLLKRLKVKLPFDANKLYASEILSILLQNTPENRELIGELDGIDVILQQLAYYKRHDPASSEEQEMMENLFNCLCSCLMFHPNKDRFLKGEGLQLMNLMLREKKLSRNGSLKVLDHAMSGPEGKDNCNKFVDILGLRTIFPLFMKTPKKNRKKVITVEEHEEHVLSIVCSMLKNCKGAQKQRLLSKFTENDHEKVDRLLELHFKYMEKVEEVDLEIEENQRIDKEELDEEEVYLKRLEGGLFTLQLIGYILLEVCCSGAASIKQRVVQIINLRGGSLKAIRHIMREYAGNLGDTHEEEAKKAEEQYILQLIDKF